jgi:hypothetical protein
MLASKMRLEDFKMVVVVLFFQKPDSLWLCDCENSTTMLEYSGHFVCAGVSTLQAMYSFLAQQHSQLEPLFCKLCVSYACVAECIHKLETVSYFEIWETKA